MKARHALTAALCGLVLSCQGPAFVIAREAPAHGTGAQPSTGPTVCSMAPKME